MDRTHPYFDEGRARRLNTWLLQNKPHLTREQRKDAIIDVLMEEGFLRDEYESQCQ